MINLLFKHLRYISLFCVIAVMVIIFLFSAQSAEESSELSGQFVEIIIKIFIPDYNNLSLLQQKEINDKIGFIIRKAAHFTEFSLLGFFLMLHLSTISHIFGKIKNKTFFLFCISWFFGTFYAVTDEIHQSFVSGRYSSIKDVLIDSSGVLFGIMILIIFLPIFIRRFKNKYTINISN